MPNFPNGCVSAELQMATSFNDDGNDCQYIPVTETPLDPETPETVWTKADGIPHPVIVTTVQTPAKIMAEHKIPFQVVVKLHDPALLPPHMKGDIRVELLVDGVSCGLKYFRESKYKAKGMQFEFTGYRVGRTEERAFAFNPMPKMKVAPEFTHGELQNYGLGWVQEMQATGNIGRVLTGELHSLHSADPPQPDGLPPGVSVIQIIVSVGKKYRTLEKYFMYGAKQVSAFYHAPRPPAELSLDSKNWKPPVNQNTPKTNGPGKRTVGGPTRIPLSGGHIPQSSTSNNSTQDQIAVGIQGARILDTSSEMTTWRPVGLQTESSKTVQSKEVEFAGRIHLVRFMFIVVPPPGLTLPVPGCEFPSMVIVLKIPSWKRVVSGKDTENSVNDSPADSGHSLGTLAHAAANVETASAASSGLTTPTSLPSPPANILEGSPPKYRVKAEPMSPDSLKGFNIGHEHRSPEPYGAALRTRTN